MITYNPLYFFLGFAALCTASPHVLKRAALSCPTSDATVYTTPSGTAYIIECGIDHSGNDIGWIFARTFEDCLAACASTTSCIDVTWVTSGYCYKKNGLAPVTSTDNSLWSARVAQSLPSTSLACPASHGSVYTVGGKNFMVECYTDRNGNDLGPVSASSLNSCIQSCASNSACVAASYVPGTGWCWLKNLRGTPYAGNTGVMGLRLIDAGAKLPNPTLYSGKRWSGFAGVQYWFAFGDSYSTDSFNTQGAQPSSGNPIGNPGPPFQTTAAGPNYLIFLAETYNKSTLLMYDFAQSGAILPDPSVLGLGQQLPHEGTQQVQNDWLENYASTLAVPWTSRNSMFSFWFGINDVVDLVGLSSSAAATYTSADIAAYRAQLEFVYNQGGRNFLIINVPPTDRTPGWNLRSAADRQNLAALIPLYNTALVNMVSAMRVAHADATVFYYDAWTTFNAVISDPKSRAGTAGLATTATWCNAYIGTTDPNGCNSTCSYGCVNKYMWQDYIHPTWVIHGVIATEIVALLG